MIRHGNKQIKVQLMPSLHLNLHGAAPLEDPTTPNDHRQVMSAKARLGVGRIVVRKPSRPQDHVDRDSALEALLTKSEALELVQAVLLGCAVHRRVPEDQVLDAGVVDRRFAGWAAALVIGVFGVLEFPRVATLAV